MAQLKPKKIGSKKIDGKVLYKSNDRITVKMELEDKGQMGSRGIEFSAADFPADYDPTTDYVVGTYHVEYEVMRKA